MQYLQGISTGDTAVLYYTIDMDVSVQDWYLQCIIDGLVFSLFCWT